MRWIMLALLFFVGLAAGCSGPDDGKTEWRGQTKGAPALWHVTGANGEAWLFGSVHALPDAMDWSTPRLEQAIAASDRLVLEVAGLEDQAALREVFQELGNSPDQPPLEERLSPSLVARAKAMGGPSDAALASLENWAAAISYASLSTSKLPISASNGVEQRLGTQFRKLGKPVIGLETAARQFSYFDQLAAADQQAMLESVIADANKAPAAYQALVNSWLAGDLAALAKSTNSGLLERPQVRAAILVARNRDWTDQIDAMIRLGAKPFVAVGAAHLAGDDSVAAMLTAQGYTVTRIQ